MAELVDKIKPDPLQAFKEWLDKENNFPPEKWIYDWVKYGKITLEEFRILLNYCQYKGSTK